MQCWLDVLSFAQSISDQATKFTSVVKNIQVELPARVTSGRGNNDSYPSSVGPDPPAPG